MNLKCRQPEELNDWSLFTQIQKSLVIEFLQEVENLNIIRRNNQFLIIITEQAYFKGSISARNHSNIFSCQSMYFSNNCF